MRNEILKAMLKHKDIIHDEHDPEEIEYLGEVFDIRLWDLAELRQKHDSEEEVVDDLHSTLSALIDKSEDFLIGEDLHSLKSELKTCITILVPCSNLTSEACDKNTVSEVWKTIFQHPQIKHLQTLVDVVDRLTTIANTEASCERANSKYNLSKNNLSSRMKLPMILARNRAGSNGPPLHEFDPHPILAYWKQHHTRLAIKTQWASESSRVLDRIRAEESKKFTTKIFST